MIKTEHGTHSKAEHTATLRKKIYQTLEPSKSSTLLAKVFNGLLILLITINVLAVSLETVKTLYAEYKTLFDAIELISVTVFTLEFGLRLWSQVEAKPGSSALKVRLKWLISPMALIDLIAILPFYLSLFFALDLRFLRVLRLLRVFKLTRYSTALVVLLEVFREEASALLASFFILFVLLILAASGAYLVENQVQPEAFGSVPKAMWWAMVTLTTVGYGDVTPITLTGRMFGGLVTVIGVGMAALPAGILASGLADHLHRRRDSLRQQFRLALEDGAICQREEAELEALRVELGLSKPVAKMIEHEVMYKQTQGPAACECPHCGHHFIPGSPALKVNRARPGTASNNAPEL